MKFFVLMQKETSDEMKIVDLTDQFVNGYINDDDHVFKDKPEDPHSILLDALDLAGYDLNKKINCNDQFEDETEIYRPSFLDINDSEKILQMHKNFRFREDYESDIDYLRKLNKEQRELHKFLKTPEVHILLSQYEPEEITPELIKKIMSLN